MSPTILAQIVSKAPASLPPEVLDFERVKHVVAGSLQSRSDPERQYAARLLMEVDGFCACPGSSIKGSLCVHLKELLANLDASEMKQWILDSIKVGAQETST